MSLFLATFFLLYGGMQFYFFQKTRYVFPFGIKIGIFFATCLLIMVLAPFIVRLSERAGHEYIARFMAYAGYTWMAFLFLFFSLSILIDVCRLVLYLVGLISQRDFSRLTTAYRLFFLVSIVCSLSAVVYGYFEARDIRTVTIVIRTEKIPKEAGGLKIAQISDVHIGLIVGEERLKKILNVVKKENPDILVSTGDLVDGQLDHLDGLAELFREINPRYGKFAVTGNHEFYAGIRNAVDFTEKAGFRMLRGEGLTILGLMNIVGVDDIAGKTAGIYKDISEKVLLSGFPSEKFTLLLKHRPVVEKDVVGLFDLQLSGHTHKGQIFPFRYLTKLFFPTYTGYFSFGSNSRMYASRGSGTWGPPIRFLTPPEVTVIELVPSTMDEGQPLR